MCSIQNCIDENNYVGEQISKYQIITLNQISYANWLKIHPYLEVKWSTLLNKMQKYSYCTCTKIVS